MKPDLFLLIKHGSILVGKLIVILGGASIGFVQRVLADEPEPMDQASTDQIDSEEIPVMYSMDPARDLDPQNYFGILHDSKY